MTRKEFRKSVQRIYSTMDNEIDCEAVANILPRYIDAEIAGREPAKEFPQVHAHLSQCPDCQEEYRGTLQVARLASQDALPAAEEIASEWGGESVPQGPIPAR